MHVHLHVHCSYIHVYIYPCTYIHVYTCTWTCTCKCAYTCNMCRIYDMYTCTFTCISCCAVCGCLPHPQIEQEEVHASLDQAEGMVSFSESPEGYDSLHMASYLHSQVHVHGRSIRPAICVVRAWRKTPTLPVTPAQLMRPGIGRNASCALGDCLTSRP